MDYQTAHIAQAMAEAAPDGASVLPLVRTDRGSMAHFTLAAGETSAAVVHEALDELWFFVSGAGRLWRSGGQGESIEEVETGVCVSIPRGVAFQWRNTGDQPLRAVGVTMPPWSGDAHAQIVEGPWD